MKSRLDDSTKFLALATEWYRQISQPLFLMRECNRRKDSTVGLEVELFQTCV